ncbi:MAG: DUF4832 domain-containing protein [Acidobacteriaceae bacterium]
MRSLNLAVLLLCAGYFSMGYSGPLFAQYPTGTVMVKPGSEPPLTHLPLGTVVVKPKPFDGVLVNPDIGFTTFQRFNGDSLNAGIHWTEGFPIEYQHFDGKLQNKDYPMTSIAYFRIYWRFVEPDEEVYNWNMLDKALQTAHARHQTLQLAIAPYGTGPDTDVPAWYRKVTGEVLRKAPNPDHHYSAAWERTSPISKPDWVPYDPEWMVDPMNPAYAHFFGGMIRALGARYDGNPDLDLVDISFVGPWGEGDGTGLLTTKVMHELVDSYVESFRKTPLVTQLFYPKVAQYALSQENVGWDADCLGDLGGFSKTFNHMTDLYPESIVGSGLQDAWKKAPVMMEACWVMQKWENKGWDVRYIINQAIKWHVSSFNAKSSAVPKDLWPEVNRWLKHMGYRFDLRRFTYPSVIGPDRRIAFTSWWENDGNAPCYRNFPLALRLSNKQTSVVMVTDADIRKWLPGDNLYNNSVFIPADLPDGDYDLSIALVAPATRKPAIKLAIQGVGADGWYSMGDVTVHQTLALSPATSQP